MAMSSIFFAGETKFEMANLVSHDRFAGKVWVIQLYAIILGRDYPVSMKRLCGR